MKKKICYFGAAFLPILVSVGLQLLAAFFLTRFCIFFIFDRDDMYTVYTNMLTDADVNTCILVIFSLLAIPIFGAWYYHSLNGDFLPDIKKTFHPLQFVALLILIPGAQFGCGYLTSILSAIFPSWLEAYEKLLETAGINDDITFLLFLYSVILAPIGEELIFRGVTLRSALRIFPFWAANLFQAILFGAYHMNMLQGCYAAALGLAMGYICEKGGSIYLSIFFHMLINLWGTSMSWIYNIGTPYTQAIFMLLTTILSLSIGIPLFKNSLRRKKINNQKRSMQANIPL